MQLWLTVDHWFDANWCHCSLKKLPNCQIPKPCGIFASHGFLIHAASRGAVWIRNHWLAKMTLWLNSEQSNQSLVVDWVSYPLDWIRLLYLFFFNILKHAHHFNTVKCILIWKELRNLNRKFINVCKNEGWIDKHMAFPSSILQLLEVRWFLKIRYIPKRKNAEEVRHKRTQACDKKWDLQYLKVKL